jgi:hypothetical protein
MPERYSTHVGSDHPRKNTSAYSQLLTLMQSKVKFFVLFFFKIASHLWVRPLPTHSYDIILRRLDKHSSSSAWSVSDKEKSFITTTTGNSITKLFSSSLLTNGSNKLKCFVPGKTLQLNVLSCKLQLSGAPQG